MPAASHSVRPLLDRAGDLRHAARDRLRAGADVVIGRIARGLIAFPGSRCWLGPLRRHRGHIVPTLTSAALSRPR